MKYWANKAFAADSNKPAVAEKAYIATQARPIPERTHLVREKTLAVTGKTLPKAAEITLKQEKEASEQAEITLKQEKVIL